LTAGNPSSSAEHARRALGNRLREIRTDAGLTARQLGQLMGRHGSKISRVEHGAAMPSADDIRAWCHHSGAESETADLIASLRSVEGMWTNWRRMERTGLKSAQRTPIPTEERTRRFRAYSSWLIPGIVQTQGYTRAILTAISVRRRLPDDVDAAVAVRVERQQRLHDSAKTWAILVEESVLRTGVGGPQVMTGQLGHLIVCASLPNVSLGVVPAGPSRDPAWPVEDFWVYDDAQVNVELVSGWLTITQPSEVAMYGQAFAELSDVAVYGSAARALIMRAIEAIE
jgi:transcriptional regulator with XRE-family HTH domain